VNAIDWFILAGLCLSALVGVLRGAAYELISLGGWLAAFILAHQFSPWVAEHYLQAIAAGALRNGVAWVACFILVLLAAGLLATVMRLLLRSTGLGVMDRSLGALFGLARGLVLLVLTVLAAGYTGLPHSAIWRTSLFIPPAAAAAATIEPLLPAAAARVLPRQ
jgi:membrane protein required for colicin V production